MKQLKRDKRPLILTVDGKVEAVLQDAATYRRLEESETGKGRDVDEFFADFETRHRVSR